MNNKRSIYQNNKNDPSPFGRPNISTNSFNQDLSILIIEKEEVYKQETTTQVFLPDEIDPSYALILQMMQEDLLENDDREVAKKLDETYYSSYDRPTRSTPTNSYYDYNYDETDEDDYGDSGHYVNDFDLSYENLVQLQPVVVGATNEQIASIEETLYFIPGVRNKQSANNTDTRCTICLEDFEPNQLIKILPKCKHHYHSECIDPWFANSKFCPQCRVEL
ncbi:hypothetical protein RB653_001058 [Dictyostelium firmibasis]|uniref:RING-type domain-containing protein n=1 Tax=Dictyostelium firmibasis TaxID=79012 RepID=A0AAN7Z1S4_9MYCE